jgi:hypothetical protein
MPHWSCIDGFTFAKVAAKNDHVDAERRSRGLEKIEDQPFVTLFYDTVKKLTVAVLSPRTEPRLMLYLESRVSDGSAWQVSPLYFELEGYVRENRNQIRGNLSNKSESGTKLVSIAIGSLEESDEAQRREMQEDLDAERASRDRVDDRTLEKGLALASQHRLQDDLDVLSIYSMCQASKLFARVALRMVCHRLASTKLSLTPFVDGVSLSGFSKVVRRDGSIPLESMSLARHNESGREIEYERMRDILLVGMASSTSSEWQLEPVFQPAPGACNTVSWKCEEIALANLHRWWGDITLPEYVGQKLLLSWIIEPGSVDDVSHFRGSCCVPVSTLKLPGEARLSRGEHRWSLPQAQFRLEVLESIGKQLDDVTMSYSGRMEVIGVRLDFVSLVKASARALVPDLIDKYKALEETRPLMMHEIQYMQQVESLAHLVS